MGKPQLSIQFENFHRQPVAEGKAKIAGVDCDGGLLLACDVLGCGADFANYLVVRSVTGELLGRFHVLDLRDMDETHFRFGMRFKRRIKLVGWLAHAAADQPLMEALPSKA